jgi:hypothetical protein
MALFGDLGKALGLGSGEDLLPLIGTAAGFYFGGPMGASIGSGIGSLAGGKSVNDALSNAALAYGVTSFVSPSFMSQSAQANTGMFGSNALQQSLYNTTPVGIAAAPSVTSATAGAAGDTAANAAADVATSMADSGSASGGILDFMGDNKLLTASLGSSALGLLMGEPEDDPTKERPYAEVSGFDVNAVDPVTGEVLNLKDPEDSKQYTESLEKARSDLSTRYSEPVTAAHGGAMYTHDKMGYDVAVRGEVDGPGTGTSDSVPAKLSDGEFVLTAKAVRGAGGGDRDMGAARLYDMMAELEATA